MSDKPKDAPGWVIERYIGSTLHYWGGRDTKDWRTDNSQALRFARDVDAACMLTWHCDGIGRVTQHVWLP